MSFKTCLKTMLLGLAVGTPAFAHELSVEKTVNGEASFDITAYPATLNYHLKVCNTAADPSDVLTVDDSLLGASCTSNFGPVPFTLPVGQCAEIDCTLVVDDAAECTSLAGGGGQIVNTFTATFEEGSSTGSTVVTCLPLTAFECDSTPYIVTGAPSVLNTLDPVTGQLTPITPLPTAVNGIGFNATDGFIYGITNQASLDPQHLVRIGASGTYEDVGPVVGLSGGSSWPSGTMLPDGSLLIRNDVANLLARIDTATGALISQISIDHAQLLDFAVNPIDGLIYGYELSENRLTTLNPNTGALTTLVSGIPPGNTDFTPGAAYFDQTGAFFIYGSDVDVQGSTVQNRLYQVNLATGAMTLVVTGPTVFSSDAASCIIVQPGTKPRSAPRITRDHGFYKVRPDSLAACLSQGPVALGDGLSVSTEGEGMGFLWTAPYGRSEEGALRLQVARELLTARCNERLFGASLVAPEANVPAAGLARTAELTSLVEQYQRLNQGGRRAALPVAFDPGPVAPVAAQRQATPTGIR